MAIRAALVELALAVMSVADMAPAVVVQPVRAIRIILSRPGRVGARDVTDI